MDSHDGSKFLWRTDLSNGFHVFEADSEGHDLDETVWMKLG